VTFDILDITETTGDAQSLVRTDKHIHEERDHARQMRDAYALLKRTHSTSLLQKIPIVIMSKPILYTFPGSVWAAGTSFDFHPTPSAYHAPICSTSSRTCHASTISFFQRTVTSDALYTVLNYTRKTQSKPKSSISPMETISTRLLSNLQVIQALYPASTHSPELQNPNATLPTLEANGKVYTSTADVTAHLIKHSPVPVKAGTDFIQTIHQDSLDPNFAFMMAVSTISPLYISHLNREQTDEETLAAKAKGFVMQFLSNRQAALERHSATPEGAPHKEFYEGKIKANGGILAIYQGKASEAGKQAFIQGSQGHLNGIGEFIVETLPGYLEPGPFMGGDKPGEDDFHLAAWLTRIGAAVGATGPQDVIRAMEKAFGKSIPEKVVKYWAAWTERPSWKTVYAAGIH